MYPLIHQAKTQAERAKPRNDQEGRWACKKKTDIEAKLSIVRQKKEILSAEANFTEEKLDLPIYSREQITSAFILNHDHNLSNTEDDNIQQISRIFHKTTN